MIENLAALTTEARNPATADLDSRSTADLVRALHVCDQEAVEAVGRESDRIAAAIDAIAARLGRGGRLFYSGAGTSGRLGVLDASECPPTYNTPPEMVQGLIAGGDHALRHPVEGAEDDEQQGQRDLEARSFSAKDVLVGIAASGRTPYVLGGIAYARRLGALTVGLSCVAGSRVAQAAELEITPVTGPEAVTGSTRMKAGTATKLVLNMLSTGALVRLGYVYGNLMVNVQPTNAKLRDRSARIVSTLTGLDTPEAAALIEQAGAVKTAVVMHRLKLDRAAAEAHLRKANGNLRLALGSA
ncbi:N-acetylmuramic acid 6-phosphate etherase [Silvibacterium sp.]|uniref:N-acetylmuramic acid 6-phosphate etherase n=1 Tax=Silvibacterium sp. TaxID=1964179 RepID=UPI0039E39B3E